MPWFKKTKTPIAQAPATAVRVPEGLWIKCPSCLQVIYNKDLQTSLQVCPKCGHHLRMTATERLQSLFDGPWEEHDPGLSSTDPLAFTDTKPTATVFGPARPPPASWTRSSSAAGRWMASRSWSPPWTYSFIGGSMAWSWARRSTRAVERACPRAVRSSWCRVPVARG